MGIPMQHPATVLAANQSPAPEAGRSLYNQSAPWLAPRTRDGRLRPPRVYVHAVVAVLEEAGITRYEPAPQWPADPNSAFPFGPRPGGSLAFGLASAVPIGPQAWVLRARRFCVWHGACV
jgi:hypothetical protein